jgi:hypothetical protein
LGNFGGGLRERSVGRDLEEEEEDDDDDEERVLGGLASARARTRGALVQ